MLNATCIEDPDLEWVMIDSTIVKAHPCATGYYKNGSKEQGIGRSKGGLTSKIHFMIDAPELVQETKVTLRRLNL